MTDDDRAPKRAVIRAGAERLVLLMMISFVVAVAGTRWYLDLTGYPQVGGGELHIAHMLWGGLLLVVAAILVLVVDRPRVATIVAILAGAGTGLFIDEVGKFITASNDYFYPAAAPLIYGFFLVIVFVFLALRARPGSGPATHRPDVLGRWEDAHLPRRRFRRLLALALLLVGGGWVIALTVYQALDQASIQELIRSVANAGDKVERPTEPFFYALEAAIFGVSGGALLLASFLFTISRERWAAILAIVGLGVAVSGGALLDLYVSQVSAISTTLIDAGLLVAVLHFRNRFLVAGHEPAGT